jgi:hypothetical protein
MPFIQVKEMNSTALEALTSRRQNILDNIRDNDEAGAGYRKVFSCLFLFSCNIRSLYEDCCFPVF